MEKVASSKSEFQHFPAKTEHVALYLQHLIDTTHSQSAVDSAIYAIQWAHTMAGIPSPTNRPIIHAIREAAKRLVGTRPVNKKEPISEGMIRKLVNNSNFDNLLELRNVCIFILAYAGFFRIQEVLHIKYGDIHVNSGYVVINVDVSKTDQLRKGNEVVISVGSGEKTCPVKGPLKYLVAKLHGCYPAANSLPVSQNFFARFFRRRPIADSSRCLTFLLCCNKHKKHFLLTFFITNVLL